MIRRELATHIKKLWKYYPVVSLNGPRQSGKTTLLKQLFPKVAYCSFEDPDIRMAALNDPRGFLTVYPKGAIFDEVQRVPELFSYIQTTVDNDKTKRFILSGSQNFLLNEKITQSLAGRVGKATLLPFSFSELNSKKLLSDLYSKQACNGFYPAVYDRKIPFHIFYSNYIETYIERDVRTLKNIGNLEQFLLFLKFLAGLSANLINLSTISSALGISVNTVKSWLSVLSSSYIIFLLQPHFLNFNKRLVKQPKLYFYDTGLLCYLLGIKDPYQIENNYMKGFIFENLVIAELYKQYFNQLLNPSVFFWRDHKGIEIDCIIENDGKLIPVEIKSSATFHNDFLENIIYWGNLNNNNYKKGFLIYNGEKRFIQKNIEIINWQNIGKIIP